MDIKPTITIEDFAKLDIRIGTVIAASEPEWSRKLLQFTVDFGADIGERTIFSGIKEWYTPEDFTGKSFPFIINLAERKMGEGVSQGMMLMADETDKPVLFSFTGDVTAGTIVR